MSARKCGKAQLSIAREGFLDRRSKRCFWLLLSPQTKVARAGARNYPRRRQRNACAGARNYPRRRQKKRSRRGAKSSAAVGRGTRDPSSGAARHLPLKGKANGGVSFNTAIHQGEGFAPAGGCSKKVHGFSAKLKGRIKESEYAIKQKER